MRIHAPKTSKNWIRQLITGLKNRWHTLLMLRDTPHRVAKGFAIGIFIGWLPIVGAQIAIAAFVSWISKANFLASMPGVWVSNPITMVPMYYICNVVGATIAGEAVSMEALSMHWEQVTSLGTIDAMKYLVTELSSAFLAMVIGGTLIGIVAAVPGYVIMQRIIVRYQERIARRRLHWMEYSKNSRKQQALEQKALKKELKAEKKELKAEKKAEAKEKRAEAKEKRAEEKKEKKLAQKAASGKLVPPVKPL